MPTVLDHGALFALTIFETLSSRTCVAKLRPVGCIWLTDQFNLACQIPYTMFSGSSATVLALAMA